MKVINKGNYNNAFPKKIVCKRIVDKYGFNYGDEKDFCGSTLEIDEYDIKKHSWTKYPNYHGVDYGVICPICKNFIPIDKSGICKNVLDNAEEIFSRIES